MMIFRGGLHEDESICSKTILNGAMGELPENMEIFN